MLKKYALSITVFYSTVLAVLSFIHISGLQEINYSNSDKIFHFIAYSGLAWFWFKALYYKFNCSFKTSILMAALISIIFGIIIEVLQGVMTSTRVAENNDIIANTLGVALTIILLFLFKKGEVKK